MYDALVTDPKRHTPNNMDCNEQSASSDELYTMADLLRSIVYKLRRDTVALCIRLTIYSLVAICSMEFQVLILPNSTGVDGLHYQIASLCQF